MWEAQQRNKPVHRGVNDWHLPYITEEEHKTVSLGKRLPMSVARCARVSYKAFDGSATKIEDDIKLYEKLVGAHPMHASPAEHQARPDHADEGCWDTENLHGNFVGWCQHRKMLKGENVS
jgi:hypothetical protein